MNCYKDRNESGGIGMEQGGPRIIACPDCGAKNRVPADRMGAAAKCGKCGTPLKADSPKEDQREAFLFRCPQCGTRNRIPLEKVETGPKCGKCGTPLETEELFEEQPLMITDGNFDDKITKSPLPVLLFAWAPWCPTCNTFTPVIDDFAQASKGKVRVGKVNVDANPALSSKFNVLSVPQILVFDNGQLKETLPGAMQKHEIMMKMSRYL